MLIKVKSGLKKQEIIELLEAYTIDGVKYKHLVTKGLIMDFEVEGFNNIDEAISKTKKIIKGEKWGAVLYLSVTES